MSICLAQGKPIVELVYQSKFEQKCIEKYLDNQTVGIFDLLLASDPAITPEKADKSRREFYDFLDGFEKKASGKGLNNRTASELFYKVHRKFLKRYVPFSSLGATFNDGSYDCLSGTALYTLILEQLGIEYEVVETNYHMYLKIHTLQGPALMESTDPLYGFIDNQKEIDKLINDYNNANTANMKVIPTNQKDKGLYKFNFNLNQVVGLYKLVGLQYYNMAVDTYNHEQIVAAINYIEKANLFYNSKRIKEFTTILRTNVLADNKLNKTLKGDLLVRINRIISPQITVAFR